MMFLILKPWYVGSAGGTRPDICVPPGTRVDGSNPQFMGTPLPSVMPVDCQALAAAAWTALNNWYGPMGLTNWLIAKGF
jgi:hypothetical protein